MEQTTRRAKRLLIINLHSTANAGDFALLQMCLSRIYALDPTVEITLSVNDPHSFSKSGLEELYVPSFFGKTGSEQRASASKRLWLLARLYSSCLWVAIVYRLTSWDSLWSVPTGFRSTIRAYLDADVVVSCPGNFIYSRASSAGLPILVPLWAMYYAWLLGKPFYLLPQTIGPIQRRWEEIVLRWVLSRARWISVREPKSAVLLQRLGFGSQQFDMIPDLAFEFPSAGQEVGHELLRDYGVETTDPLPRMGVTLIDWGAQNPVFLHQERYETAVAEAIRVFLEETGGEVIIFSQVCGPTAADDDRIPARRVLNRLASLPVAIRLHMIDAAIPPDRLKAAYGLMDFFLGSRLHSCIFALGVGVPTFAIAYQDKTEGVMKMLNLDDWFISIEQTAPNTLIPRVQTGWRIRETLKKRVELAVDSVQAELRQRLDTLLLKILTDEASA